MRLKGRGAIVRYTCHNVKLTAQLHTETLAQISKRNNGDPPAPNDALQADICSIPDDPGSAAAVCGLWQTLWQHEHGEKLPSLRRPEHDPSSRNKGKLNLKLP